MGVLESLEAMNEALESLPERLAEVLSQPAPTLRDPGGLDGATLLPSVNTPDASSEAAQPLAPTPSVRVVDWTPGAPPPAVRTPGEGPDPLMLGTPGGNAFDPLPPPIGAPASQGGQGGGTDLGQLVALAQKIVELLERGGASGGGVAARPLPGGGELPWESGFVRDFDGDEGYAFGASPSINVGGNEGSRGAGGATSGSAFRGRRTISAGGLTQGVSTAARNDFLEPERG